MFKWAAVTAISIFIVTIGWGQAPAPSSTPAASNSPVAGKSAAASPAPAPTNEQIISALGENDLQMAISLFKSNFANPDSITDAELNRATLAGLLVRLPGALVLLPSRGGACVELAQRFHSV